MKNIAILKGRGFTLRPIKKGDEFSIQENANNKDVAKNMSDFFKYPYTLKHAKDWIKKRVNLNKKEKNILQFIIDINGKAIGSIGLHPQKNETFKASMGYWLGEEYWGRGIMTEAIRLITNYGFKKLKLKRIYSYVYLFNPVSKKVLEKNGFKLEGILKKDFKKDGKFLDVYLLAKTK